MGEKAYKQTPKEELIFACLTTFVESSYYEAKDTRLDRIKTLVAQVAKKDPEFVAKLAIYARREFHMRSIFPVLIGELSKNTSGNDVVRRAIRAGTTRVDDLTELAAYVGPKKMKSSMKRGIADALNKFGEYEMAKYKSDDKDVSLVDLVNLVHPKANNQETASALKKLMTGELKNVDTWESQMSAGKSALETFSGLMDQNKLGYMALLRNLRNILKTGDSTLIKRAADMISNPEQVRRSKQLPFRFLSAAKALQEMGKDKEMLKFEKDIDHNQLLVDAVDKALTVSVQNIPLLTGRTMILSDNSGSMGGSAGGSAVSAMSSVQSADIANLFATLYWTRAENTMVGLFGDKLVNPNLDRSKGVLENFKKITKEAGKCGPGTETGVFNAFESLIATKTMVDRIVIFSDCQVGRGCKFYDDKGRQAASFNTLFNQYRKINPNVKVYTVDLKGYGNSMTTDDGMLKITGWSDKIFSIMESNELRPGAMVSEVEKVSLN